MSRSRQRRWLSLAKPLTLGAAALLLSGCSALSGGVYEAPLPGGADVGSDPITITADFDDVLDLVPQSSVKVDNVAVGRVSKISLNPDGRSAQVELIVNGEVPLPAGTSARVQQTSLLGEKYVALVRPEKPASGPAVGDGDEISLEATSQAAEVEQVLGALSLVLNGGGIGQFQEISRELQKVNGGRPKEIKAFLTEMKRFVTTLDSRKDAITGALDGLAALSESLEADKDKIATALDDLSPGMQVVVDQREQLVSMLKALDKLSVVTIDTLDAAQDDIVEDLKLLQPILHQLAKSGSNLTDSLQILLTYPFPDSVLAAIKGDYLNVFITTNFRTLPDGCTRDSCAWPQVSSAGGPLAHLPSANDEETKDGRKRDGGEDSDATDPPPSLLPPTTSPTPGALQETVPVPATPVPTDGSTTSPGTPPTSAPTTPGDDATDFGPEPGGGDSSPGTSSGPDGAVVSKEDD